MKPRLLALHPVLGVRDVEASIRFYERLGFVLTFRGPADQPGYASLRRDAVELHLQWTDGRDWRPDVDHPVYRVVVDDVDGLHRELVAAGVTERITEVWDTSWGTREFHVQDPDLNGLQFYRDR